MTIVEAHYDFKLKAGEVEALSSKAFLDAEIDWLLNEAQVRVVKRRLSGNNVKRTGVEQTQKRIDDLKELYVTSGDGAGQQPGIIPSYDSDLHIYEVDLSTLAFPYLQYGRAVADLADLACTYKGASVDIVQHDDFNDAKVDPFNKSTTTRVLANFGRSSDSTSSALYLYPDPDHVISKVFPEYYKYPSKVYLGTYTYIDGSTPAETQFEVAEHLHPEIVDEAVKLALGMINDPQGLQIALERIQTQE